MDSQSLHTLVEAELSRTQFVLEKSDTRYGDSPRTGKILEALKSHSKKLEELIQVQGEALSRLNLFRIASQKEQCEHHLRVCKQLNDALMSFVIARMDENIHSLMSDSTMIDAGIQDHIAQGTWLQGRCNEVIDALERLDHKTHQMHIRQMRGTPLEKSANTQALSEQDDYGSDDESNNEFDDDGNSSLMSLRRYDRDLPRIKTFHHLCLRGLDILAQISSLEEFETYFTRLETWSFGLMGRTDGRSDQMSLDAIFRLGDESFRPSDVHSLTGGYYMIVVRFLKILLYIESLLITIEPDSADAVSYLNLLQDFFETSIVASMMQKTSMEKLEEAKTVQSKVMICVSGIEDQVRRLYDILPAIGSTRQVFCFRGVFKPLGHVTTSSSREQVRRTAKRHEDKSESQDLVEFNAQLSDAIAASLRGKKEEDIRKEAKLFEKVNDQLRTWKETRKGEFTAQMIKTLKKMREPLRNLHHDLKIDPEDPTSSTEQRSFISPKLVSETRRTFEGCMEDLLK